MHSNSVAIVGGGITGLTAAFRLRQRGIPVTVFEATSRVGGAIQSVRREGYLAEFGPNTLLETSPKITSLVEDLGLVSRRLYSDPKAEKRYLVRDGKTLALAASPAAFLGTPLFSAKAKLRLFCEPFVPRGPANVEESIAAFVVRRIGREFLDYAINPLVSGIYAGDPARLSVQHAFPKLLALERRYGSLIRGQIFGARERRQRAEVSKQSARKLSFDEGLQVLVDELHRQLGPAVLLDTPVTSIRQSPESWEVTAGASDARQIRRFAGMLFTGTSHQLAQTEIIAPGTPSLAPLSEIVYPPVASVVLGFRRAEVAHPLDGFGVLIPAVEGFRILGTLFSSSLFPNRAPAGYVTLTSYVGGMRQPDLARQDPEAIIRLTVEDCRRLFGISGKPTFQQCVVYPRAIPQYEVGYGRFKSLMSDMEAKAPGFFIAGHYRDGISLSDTLVAGHDAAARIDGWLSRRSAPVAPEAQPTPSAA